MFSNVVRGSFAFTILGVLSVKNRPQKDFPRTYVDLLGQELH